jgi:hypothetical protein
MMACKGRKASGWNGLFAPKGTPPEIVAKPNTLVRTAVESDAMKRRFHDLASVPPDANERTPEVLQQFVTRDVEKHSKLLANEKPCARDCRHQPPRHKCLQKKRDERRVRYLLIQISSVFGGTTVV